MCGNLSKRYDKQIYENPGKRFQIPVVLVLKS